MNSHAYLQQLAYQLWEAEGRPEGQAIKHWNEAKILLQNATKAPHEVSKTNASEADKAIAREQPDQT